VYATTCQGGGRVLGIGKDGDIYSWTAPFGTPRRIHPEARAKYLSCSSDGKRIAAGLHNGNVSIFDGDGTLTQNVSATKHDIQAIALSADGSLLAVATNDTPTQLWDTKTGKQLAVGTNNLGATAAVAFAPDGRMYVSADEDTIIRAYDQTGKALYKTEDDLLEPFAVVFTPDGKQFAVAGGGGAISLFDAASGRKLKTSGTNGNPIFQMMMSPTGQQIATLEMDDYKLEPAAITLWDLKSPELKKVDVDLATVVGAGTDKSNLLLIKSDGPGEISLWSIH
jgi:WD40 repeat protein